MSAWGAGVSGDAYLEALQKAAVSSSAPIALNVHVPFCPWRCWYCACTSSVRTSPDSADEFLGWFVTEAQRVGVALGGRPVGWLRVGGGTPGFLRPDQLDVLLNGIDDAFCLSEETRRSVEVDAASAGPDTIYRFTRRGFGHLVLGVQDVDVGVGRAVGRVVSGPKVARLVETMRETPGATVDCDIMYGLPGQTPASLGYSVDRLVALLPDGFRVFRYAHLPELYPRQVLLERSGLPTARQLAELAHTLTERLAAAGYHVAGPGFLTRTGRGFSEGHGRLVDRVGLGPGAYGMLNSLAAPVAVRNVLALNAYGECLQRPLEVPVGTGYVLSAIERRRWRVIASILERGEAVLQEPTAGVLSRLSGLEAQGLVRWAGDSLVCTRAGHFFRDEVARAVDAHYGGWSRDLHEALGS